mmetsp:Transcript_49633/g.84920  ORF Transcript_49633/g.84920 Transcript_49633/m.84920 type:complete len:202 (-) Transcript_49633:107-712(-)
MLPLSSSSPVPRFTPTSSWPLSAAVPVLLKTSGVSHDGLTHRIASRTCGGESNRSCVKLCTHATASTALGRSPGTGWVHCTASSKKEEGQPRAPMRIGGAVGAVGCGEGRDVTSAAGSAAVSSAAAVSAACSSWSSSSLPKIGGGGEGISASFLSSVSSTSKNERGDLCRKPSSSSWPHTGRSATRLARTRPNENTSADTP